jgi:sulfate transport system ATP-binding protein/putative spermidine/putrescine transport system ATP-binding protein
MSLVKNLIKSYPASKEDPAFYISVPEWQIADTGVTALWGPSGSGKTSIFRILIGLESCPGLSWDFKGVDLTQLPVGKRQLGVVFQELHLFPHMTTRGNIEFAARSRGCEVEKFLSRWTEPLQLKSFLDRKVERLSGGERQRVALARALAGEPKFLFLDEPFSALNEELKEESREMVAQVIQEANIPCLLITHDREDLQHLAEHVVTIKGGTFV